MGSRPAAAFSCSRTQADNSGNPNDGPSLSWSARQLSYTLNNAGTAAIPFSSVQALLGEAFAVWQNLLLDPNDINLCGALPGTDVTFQATAPTAADWVGYNFLDPPSNTNTLIFRDDNWPYPDNSGDIIAQTTITFSALSGEIIDADIEFNSANYTFVTGNPSYSQTDLLNTAVHEVGHFLGLAHCLAVTCTHMEVMLPVANPGDISKRLLKCDDRAGMVFKYPAGQSNGYCNDTAVSATCGNCAPPSRVSATPIVQLAGRNSGRDGSSCQQSAAPVPAAWLSLLWLSHQPRRRRRRPAATQHAP